jgi:hypothetical protein
VAVIANFPFRQIAVGWATDASVLLPISLAIGDVSVTRRRRPKIPFFGHPCSVITIADAQTSDPSKEAHREIFFNYFYIITDGWSDCHEFK